MTLGAFRRAYQYRFYPTAAQEKELLRTFGCVRKVYNLALELRSTAWSTERRRIGYHETSALLTQWKKSDELRFLSEVSSVPLQQALRHLQSAFESFWAKTSAYPRFKAKRRSRSAAEYTRSGFRWRDGELKLAKMDEPLKIVWSRELPANTEPSTVTVSRDRAGRWFVSILVQDSSIRELPPADSSIGVDLGVANLATLSTGQKIANPRHETRDRTKLIRAQRQLGRKADGSKNRDKAKLKLAKVHARIRDRRRDHLHKLTTQIVRENQTVVIEDLSVRNMVKNHALARSIADAAWYEIRTMLQYKCRWYGRTLVAIDRWYPSSRTCSTCGHMAATLTLDMREWQCCSCGAAHDRDINAARNILAAGLAVIACGGGVRPEPSVPGRPSSAKQEGRRVTAGIPTSQELGRCQPSLTARRAPSTSTPPARMERA